MRLSKHFVLKEFTKSSTAIRLGIDNTPTKQQIENIKKLVINILEPLRLQVGRLNINSGFRKPELCEAIGSSKHSNHAFGFAADVEPNDPNETFVTNLDCLNWIAENVEYKELIAEYFNSNDKDAGWVHVAYQEGNNKGVIKLKDEKHNYEVVTLEYINKLYGE